MNAILTFILNLFQPAIVNIETRVLGAFSSIVSEQPQDQIQILHDAMAAFMADVQGGKGLGQAAADALDTFFNEEKGEVSKVTKQLFSAFLTATGG